MLINRLEILLTLVCPWRCQRCCRGCDVNFPVNSHVTLEQMGRLIQYFREQQISVNILSLNGGEPLCNPEFEEICWLVCAQKWTLWKRIKLFTAYPLDEVRKRVALPKQIRKYCMPQTEPHKKSSHTPMFLSPVELGVLAKNQTPFYGSWETKLLCARQQGCGRCFSRWGFTASSMEATLGRVLGFPVFSKELKLWGNPDVCRQCIFGIRRRKRYKLEQAAMNGEIPEVSAVYQLEFLRQRNQLTESLPPW